MEGRKRIAMILLARSKIRFFLVLVTLFVIQARRERVVFGQGSDQQRQIHRSIRQGLDYLFSQQEKEGGFRSSYYGNLKGGAGVTALVLFAISGSDTKYLDAHGESIRQAFGFLRKGIRKHGFVANPSGPDYAVYSTALLLLADSNLRRHPTPRAWQGSLLENDERLALQKFLCQAQLGEVHQIKAATADYGGWDLSGWMLGPRVSRGTNVSVTSFAVWALAEDQSEAAKIARSRSRKWLSGVQNPDGGFHFHPVKNHVGNKAGWSDNLHHQPISYGTATSDGLRMMRKLNYRKDDMKTARQWIESRRFRGVVPGFETLPSADADYSWKKGLRFYHCMSLAIESRFLSLEFQKEAKMDIQNFLLQNQKRDGFWSNKNARMREDDPMIATSFACIALTYLGP